MKRHDFVGKNTILRDKKQKRNKKTQKKRRFGWDLKAWDERKWFEKRGSKSKKKKFRGSIRDPSQNVAGVQGSRFRSKIRQKIKNEKKKE